MNSATMKVAKFEVVRQIKKPSFWAAILLLPILMGVIFFISYVVGGSSGVEEPIWDENTKIAITDDAGVLTSDTPFVINGDKEYGIEKVKEGEIDFYFYIPADFVESKKAEFYHISEGLDLFNNDAAILKGILNSSAVGRVDPIDVISLTGDFEIVDNKLTKTGEEENALGKAIVPLAILVVFFMFICLFGNRFLMAVVEEKENRISEMILTAVSAKHLIVGKIIAMMVLGVIQILSFVIPVAIIVFLNRENPMVSMILSSIVLDPVSIIMNIILFIASVFFYAGACVLAGSLVSTARDASSFIGPAIVAMVFPLYFMQGFLVSEPGAIVQFLTYFPLSAPIALMLRSGFGTLSTMEFCIGLFEVVVLALIVVRFAVIAFQKNAINFGMVKLKIFSKRK